MLKPIFISFYMMAIMVIAGYAGWMLYRGAAPVAWSGVMLTVAPILSVIMVLMTFKNVARTSAHLPLINILGALGVALAIWAWQQQDADILAPALAVEGWVGFLLYSYWFSTFGNRQPSMKLIVGTKLPHFTVLDAQNKTVSSEQLTDKPAILVFYRCASMAWLLWRSPSSPDALRVTQSYFTPAAIRLPNQISRGYLPRTCSTGR